MAIARPNTLTPWCCLVSSALGVVTSILALITFLGIAFNCRILILAIISSWSLSQISNSLILLRRAYLVLYRRKWVAYIGIPLMLASLSCPVAAVFTTFSTLEPGVGCACYYSIEFLWYGTGASVLVNIFFSGIFCYIALKQYRLFRSNAWKRLARDGIQTMAMAAFSNIASRVLMIAPVGHINLDMLLIADRLFVTTILISYCKGMNKSVGTSHRPHTDFVLNLAQTSADESNDPAQSIRA
ncbi:hypothetical protein SYNPS1DRAFT_30250 [Syncephalis pseudoplumigaleata]|uniref:G-protein coupled receptors family 1 profile domain-containing protein n=1 Tax=Syncephalis pseudoplumigaleata TaxID=1712513 RepID=A0A4V1J165_9FUNG|nr:hypothetical protein SYNPS1DRAFT_30250 [Syncephalis pseudoplumigaleata]|eukprot:RKP23979.1 hypothetical protein SYNPS1DRAFT_30250 [Syncephalis pseudoplumigaleata]